MMEELSVIFQRRIDLLKYTNSDRILLEKSVKRCDIELEFEENGFLQKLSQSDEFPKHVRYKFHMIMVNIINQLTPSLCKQVPDGKYSTICSLFILLFQQFSMTDKVQKIKALLSSKFYNSLIYVTTKWLIQLLRKIICDQYRVIFPNIEKSSHIIKQVIPDIEIEDIPKSISIAQQRFRNLLSRNGRIKKTLDQSNYQNVNLCFNFKFYHNYEDIPIRIQSPLSRRIITLLSPRKSQANSPRRNKNKINGSVSNSSRVILHSTMNEAQLINFSDVLIAENEVNRFSKQRYFEFTKKTLKQSHYKQQVKQKIQVLGIQGQQKQLTGKKLYLEQQATQHIYFSMR